MLYRKVVAFEMEMGGTKEVWLWEVELGESMQGSNVSAVTIQRNFN